MRAEMAKARPVETIFSGPAASVAGARHLTGLEDMPLSWMWAAPPRIRRQWSMAAYASCSTGSTVAGRRTHVRALDIRTAGLGGDSLINREKGTFSNRPPSGGPHRLAGIQFCRCR